MTELADERETGLRMICGLLVAEGWPVNKAHQFGAPRRPSGAPDEKPVVRRRWVTNSIWRLPPEHRNHIWSHDFIKAPHSDGRPVHVSSTWSTSSPAWLYSLAQHRRQSVQSHLAKPFERRGKPVLIRADNGPRVHRRHAAGLAGRAGVRGVFIAKASPLAERVHRTLQRHDGARSSGTRSTTRSPGPASRRVADQAQHRAPASKPAGQTPRHTRRCSPTRVAHEEVVVASESPYHHRAWTSRHQSIRHPPAGTRSGRRVKQELDGNNHRGPGSIATEPFKLDHSPVLRVRVRPLRFEDGEAEATRP